MRSFRGLTVIEVVVAMALLVGVGTLLFRSFHTASLGVRSSEAAESATALMKTAVVLLSREPQPWIPDPGQTVKLTKEQIKALLAQTPEATYTDPALYEVTATRSDPTTLGLEVCVKPAGERLCFAQRGLRVPTSLVAGSGERPPPKELPPAPPGEGHLVLDISSPASADVSVAGRRYTRPGRYIINALNPGRYTLTARNVTWNGTTYLPTPDQETLTVQAGRTTQIQVTYNTGRLVIYITQSRDTSSWYSVPGFLVWGGYWQWWWFVTVWQKTFPAPGIASRTAQYAEAIKAGLTYNTDVESGHVYKVGEGTRGNTRYEDYWVLRYDGLPRTLRPGDQITVNVRWVAKRCEWIRRGKWAWQVEKRCYEPYTGPK